ncbi:MAG: hypothetical protein RKP46_13270 [Candidatus Accumulibacter sp.]|uniref:hypothetical protein n=1 Tax=Accumulibacter sp. TaxID=2053492 RepID=UPI00287975B5|nr:hypothetical protein [Accumulibacter sp.]MDS4015297.1 hypothetical protein [Accumulibacter sp.]HRK71705.1 hypothetical protein [Micropepsaceae bacterium]
MSAVLRSFLALVMVVSLLGFTAPDVSADLAAAMPEAAGHCCDDGPCPDDQDCDGDCAMLLRCGAAGAFLLQPSLPLAASRVQGAAAFSGFEPLLAGRVPDGLKRPPRI